MATHPAPKKKIKRLRILVFGLIAVLLLLGVAAFFLPYLLKRYIEKHSVEWIGRTVTIDNIILNPFTFTYAVNDVKCSERGTEETFVSWKSIAVKSNLWNGFRNKNWRFRELRVVDPYVHISQKGTRFNFSDLLELGGNDTTASTDTAKVRFSMEDIHITGGRIVYASDVLKAPVGISGLRAECTRITSESARMDFLLGLTLDGGGALDGGFKIDTEKSLYAVNATLKNFALPQLLPYLQDFMHTTALKGNLDVSLNLEDSWAGANALAVSGNLALNNLDLTDGERAHLIGLKDVRVSLDTLNAKAQSFKISRVLVDGLSTRFQQWADGSNTWTNVLKLDSTSTGDSTSVHLEAAPSNVFVMLANYIRLLGQDFVANQYTADSMVMANSSVDFEDFTPEKPFRYKLDNIDIRSSRITTATGTADFIASARLNERGELKSSFKFDPKNYKNVDAELEVKNLSLPDLDAYSRWYGAYPIQSGTLDYTGKTSIQDGRIDSENHLQADDLRFAKKTAVHDTGIFILPLRLGASLLRDVHGKIDLDVPVKGDLNDPEFKPWPIIWQVLKNLVVKAAAAPVKLVSGMFGAKDDANVEEVRFQPLSTAINKDQKRSLDALAALLKEKPELIAGLVSVTDVKEEQEEWAAAHAKMDYLQLAFPMSKADSSRMTELALRDSAFIAWLDEKVPATKGKPERERCVAAVGADVAKQAVVAEETTRQEAVKANLHQAGVDMKQIVFRPGTSEETSGYMGAPGFRFVVDVGD
jgi:hypothetical protein